MEDARQALTHRHDAPVLSLPPDANCARSSRPSRSSPAALGTAALVRAGHGRATASARAVAGLALSGCFVWLAWRLRPRAGFGVRVDLAGAELSRAIDGRPERVLWPQVKAVEQVGRWAPRWVLTLVDGTRRELPRALFSDTAVFADLGRVLNTSGSVSAARRLRSPEGPARGWVRSQIPVQGRSAWRTVPGL